MVVCCSLFGRGRGRWPTTAGRHKGEGRATRRRRRPRRRGGSHLLGDRLCSLSTGVPRSDILLASSLLAQVRERRRYGAAYGAAESTRRPRPPARPASPVVCLLVHVKCKPTPIKKSAATSVEGMALFQGVVSAEGAPRGVEARGAGDVSPGLGVGG